LFVLVLHGLLELQFFDDVEDEGVCEFALFLLADLVGAGRAGSLADVHLIKIFEAIISYLLMKLASFFLRPSLSLFKPLGFRFCSAAEEDFGKLAASFMKQRDMLVFSKMIKASNNTIDNINYFKIYKFLAENNGEIRHFEDFFQQCNTAVTKKSDNVRMLLANVKAHVAKQHE
jgi:hypothetical protein